MLGSGLSLRTTVVSLIALFSINDITSYLSVIFCAAKGMPSQLISNKHKLDLLFFVCFPRPECHVMNLGMLNVEFAK